MERNFKVGDRVRCIKEFEENRDIIGKIGTVIGIVYSKLITVEFDEQIKDGHSGKWDSTIKGGKKGHCWHFDINASQYLEHIEEHKPIVIYQKGKEVIALDKNTGKKGIAKCSPDDKFDFETGAKLAFERLYQDKGFMPYLKIRITGSNYGTIGTPTNYEDVIGRKLFVGDTVELYNRNQECLGERAIVERNGKKFVFGIEMVCDDVKGTTGGWKILKKRSYNDIKDGETVDEIKYIKSKKDF